MLWIILGGLIVLIVALVLAFAFDAQLDRPSSILATIAGGLLSASLLFYSVMVAMAVPPVNDEVLAAFTLLSGICASIAWFFIFVAMVRMASGSRLHVPGLSHSHHSEHRHGDQMHAETQHTTTGPAYTTSPTYPAERAVHDRPMHDRTYNAETTPPKL